MQIMFGICICSGVMGSNMKLFEKLRARLKPSLPVYEYEVHVREKGDDHVGYILHSSAISEDAAKEDAIQFLVKNGFWPFTATEEWIRSRLIVEKVEKQA